MKNINKKDRFRGLLGSVLFHAAFLAVFLLFGFCTPLSTSQKETGVEIRLGDLEGMGVIDLTPPPVFIPSRPSDQKKIREKILTQNSEITNPVENKIKQVKNDNFLKNKTIIKEEAVSESGVNNNMLFRSGREGGHYQGNGNKPGYQGSPDGNPNSTSPVGISSNNVFYALSGRSLKYLPKPEYNSPEQGVVVVAITVDREGKVIKAIAGAQGTTTTDTNLKRLAVNAALKATFEANPNAPEEQIGTITYKFIRLN